MSLTDTTSMAGSFERLSVGFGLQQDAPMEGLEQTVMPSSTHDCSAHQHYSQCNLPACCSQCMDIDSESKNSRRQRKLACRRLNKQKVWGHEQAAKDAAPGRTFNGYDIDLLLDIILEERPKNVVAKEDTPRQASRFDRDLDALMNKPVNKPFYQGNRNKNYGTHPNNNGYRNNKRQDHYNSSEPHRNNGYRNNKRQDHYHQSERSDARGSQGRQRRRN